MDTKAIGEFLKSLRKAKGLTQEEVANILYLSPKTISRWESGNGIPDINIISSVAELYEVSVDEILKGKRNNLNNTISQQTVQLHNKNKERVINNSIFNKLNIYFIISISVMGFFLLLELIFGLLLNEVLAVILMPIGLLIGILIEIIGNYEIKLLINNEDNELINLDKIKENIKRKNIMFIDILVIDIVVSLFILMIFIFN